MLEAEREQALAFRLAGHHLHERTDPLTAIAACGIQDYPPGWAPVALHARAQGELDPEAVTTVNAMRGAPYILPRAEAAVFTLAIVPPDDGLKALITTWTTKEVVEAGFAPREALDLVAAAAREALAHGPLGRDDFHQALRERLPPGLLPWCGKCRSHHVRPGLWRTLGPLGVTAMSAKAEYTLADWPPMPAAQARAELARRFLRCYGPATHTQLAQWAQTAPGRAKALFDAIGDELEQVRLEGAARWLLAEGLPRLENPPPATGIRLLGGYDPWVSQPDRLLAPDALRKQMFPSVGRPGVVLRDGALAGLWRGRKKGDVLEVDVEWLGEPADVEDEAGAVARLRGCRSALVR